MPEEQEQQKKQPGSRPFVVQQMPLQSFHAQQVFKRGFDIYTRSVYSISVVLRAVADEENVRAVEGIIDEKLNGAQEDMRKEMEQLRKIAEDNGITLGEVGYSNPNVVDVKISSHRSARYANIIREFDTLIASLDTLWLSGMVPDREYSQRIYEWKRRLLKIANHANGIVRQISAESRKKSDTTNEEEPEIAVEATAKEPAPVSVIRPATTVVDTKDKVSTSDKKASLFGW